MNAVAYLFIGENAVPAPRKRLPRAVARIGVLTIAFASALAATGAWADEFQSSVETYQSEANYGPEIAVIDEAYAREGKLELSAGGIFSPFSSFVQGYAATGGLTYHLSRRHSIEPIWFAQHFSSLGNFARREFRDNTNVSDADRATNTLEVPKQTFAASYFFNPYYAKMHITERTVTHFDVLMGLGGALMRNDALLLTGESAGVSSVNRFGGVATLGFRFLFPSRFGMRVEMRDFIYQQKNLGKVAWGHSLQLTLAASIFFGAFPD